MTDPQRQTLLKVGAMAVVGLFLLDRMVITPFTHSWKERSLRIAALTEKVDRGRQLVKRAEPIRTRWAEMLRTDLPPDDSMAENDAQKAVARWAGNSHITFTSLSPQWRNHEEGYDTYECRASASGDQATLARFLYEMEVDPMPVALQEFEITTRDARGQLLLMNVRFSFIRLADAAVTSTAKGATRR